MQRITGAFVAAVFAMLVSGAAQAAQPAQQAEKVAQNAMGDWVVKIEGLHFVFHIKKDDKGELTGLGDIYEQGSVDLPLVTVIEEKDGSLLIEAPAMNTRFDGRWNAAKQQWEGKYTLINNTHQVSLVRSTGKFPSADLKLGSDLDGLWEGIIKAPGLVELPVAFIIKTDGAKTEGVMELRQQRVRLVPVTGATREAPRVRLVVDGFASVFEGKVSDDKQTIAGAWHQAGNALPLTVRRKAK